MASRPAVVYLDTHVALWLYGGLREQLSAKAQRAITEGQLFISPMAELELEYLYEIGRTKARHHEVVHTLADDIGLQRSTIPFQEVVLEACRLSWTRDPFDRLIVAEALLAKAALVSKDRAILANCSTAVW